MVTRIMERRKRIALVAHDNKKKELIEWAVFNKVTLAKHRLYATGTTGSLLEEKLDQSITKLQSGPLGGDAQIAARVAEGKTKMVLFFKDPMSSHPHEPDINMLIRICDVHNVPLATNEATAQLLLNALLLEE